MKKKLAGALAAVLLVSTVVQPASAAMSVEDCKALLQAYYVNDLSEEVLAQDTIEDILEVLGDPYTEYMTAEEYQAFLQHVNGENLVGIGVELGQITEDGAVVLDILPNSPAQEAGLQMGDRIVAIDGLKLEPGMDTRSMISGSEGTQVTVAVVGEQDRTARELVLTRRSVHVPTAAYELIGSSGYIACSSFGDDTPVVAQEGIAAMDQGAAVWIVDVRSNPGGTSEAAAELVNLFSSGTPVAYFRDKENSYMPVLAEKEYQDMTDKPVIVLTDEYSASASEIFAAAARDYSFGVAIGQRTFGKGIAQIVLNENVLPDIFDGDNLKLTAFRFYSPRGASNHVIGVIPTLLISKENTAAAALLLSGEKPEALENCARLELSGYTFYLDLQEAVKKEFAPAAAELLEALPPAARLYQTENNHWELITPEALARELGLTCHFRTFTDLHGSPYQREIETLAVYQILSGVGDGRFMPKKELTRAEFCAMLTNAFHLPVPELPSAFTDVSRDAWYAGPVAAVCASGFAAGVGDGKFHPEDTVSYQEMVAMLSAVAVWSSSVAEKASRQDLNVEELPDYERYALWARGPARELYELGALIEGVPPAAAGTRELAAAAICQTMERTGLLW